MRFALRLARALGRTLNELGATMSADEFSLHYQDFCLEPWGDARLAVEMAALRSATLRGPVRNPPGLQDSLLRFDAPQGAEPAPEMDALDFVAALNKPPE